MHRTTIMLPEQLKTRVIEHARKRGQSLGEVVRESLEEWLKTRSNKPTRDPLFDDVPIYDGPVPEDYSINHDKYLYGELSDFH
jgi:Arc/MetJ-type ribon-helix-helix transcriptional regulator